MEKNIVILDLERYHELQNAEKIVQKEMIFVKNLRPFSDSSTKVISKNDAFQEIVEYNNILAQDNREISRKFDKLERENNSLKEKFLTLDTAFKNFQSKNLWQFIKYKYKLKFISKD